MLLWFLQFGRFHFSVTIWKSVSQMVIDKGRMDAFLTNDIVGVLMYFLSLWIEGVWFHIWMYGFC